MLSAQPAAAAAAPAGSDHARLLHLDGLRGVAIALVLVHHLADLLLVPQPGTLSGYAAAALTLAYTGVDLFFVLSGYLIGGILLDQAASPRLVATFYARRAARILPLAFACVAAGLALYAAGFAAGTPWSPAVYLGFGTNLWMAAGGEWGFPLLAPLWSLAIEEQFYLLAPWIVRSLSAAQRPVFFAGLVVAAPLLRWTILWLWPGSYFAASLLPFCRMDSLGLGVLAAWILRDEAASAWCRQQTAATVALLVAAILGLLHLSRIRALNAGPAMAWGGYTIVAVFYFLVLLQLELHRGSGVARWLAARPLRLLGNYSYFIYLFHGMLISLAVSLCFHGRLGLAEPAGVLQLAAGCAVLLLAAALSWRWVEQPLLAWTRRKASY